jgi:hypothetical protein
MLNFSQKFNPLCWEDEGDLNHIALRLSQMAQGNVESVNQQVQFILERSERYPSLSLQITSLKKAGALIFRIG